MYKRILNLLALLLLVGQGALAQITECKGVVRSADDKKPITGALVVVTGTTHGDITDIDGRFYIKNIPAKGTPKLTISFLGYKTTEVVVSPYGDIELPIENQMIGEIVVVAYGKSTRGALTGSVAQIESEQIADRPVSNAFSALEGNVAGVTMYHSSGLPSSSPTIRIRGYGSVNGSNDPICVIDGVINKTNMIADINPADIESISVLKDAASCALYGNRASNGVILITTKKGKTQKLSMNLSMNQGIYSRGINNYRTTSPDQYMESAWKWLRNGLMSGKTPLDEETANATASSKLISDYLLTNIYNKGNNELFDESGHLVADAKILDGYKNDLNWRDALERSGYRQEYNLNGGAAGERGNYFFSAGYLNEKGYITTTDFERYTARFGADFTPVQWLKAGINIGASHQKKHYADENTGDSNPSRISLFMLPIYPIHQHNADGSYTLDTNGNYIFDDGNGTRSRWTGTNLIQENELDTYKIDRNTLNMQGYATFKFLKDFAFTVKGNMNMVDYKTIRSYNPFIGSYASKEGAYLRQAYGYDESNVMEQLNWGHEFGKHHVEVLLDHENYSWSRDYEYLFKQKASMAGGTNISNYLTTVSSIGYKDTYKTESYLGSLKYSYDMRYNGEFSFRRDGSSRFSSDNRWGNFWSIGANWIVSSESFLKDWQWLDLLKIRASYGEVGNDASASLYAYKELYYLDPNADVPSYYLTQNAASDLKWETSKSFNVGLDFRFWGRWNLSLDYYDKRNGDLIFDVLQPSSFGGDVTVAKNIGTIRNSGFELATDVDAYRSKDWTVNLGLNLTIQKNKVTKLPDENKEGLDVMMDNSVIYRITEGKSRYEFFLPTFVGVDRLDGQVLYAMDLETYKIVGTDNNVITGNPEGTAVAATNSSTGHTNYKLINGEYYATDITYAKNEYHGSALPKLQGSFNPTIKYKNLTLSGILTFSLGSKVYDHTYKQLMTAGTTYTNFHHDILKSWNTVPEGMTEDATDRIDVNGIPQINRSNGGYNNAVSSRWLVSGDYLCIKNISFNYRLPDIWVTPLGLSGLSIGGTVENLLTVTARKGLNPQLEYGEVVGYNTSTLTVPRIFSLKVNVKL